MTPLTHRQRDHLFGPLRWKPAPLPRNPERIEILGDWKRRNIVRVEIPQLVSLGLRTRPYVWCHRLIAEPLVRLWAIWEAANIIDVIRTYNGCWVPRRIRGSKTRLSNHAYGTAFDINARWNRRGTPPPGLGEWGSVVELIPLAAECGFVWGGDFSRPDGMHFEAAEISSTAAPPAR